MLVFAISAVAWPATVTHAHLVVHAESNPHECQIIVSWDRHIGTDHTWDDHIDRETKRWEIHVGAYLSRIGDESPYNYYLDDKELDTHQSPAKFNFPRESTYEVFNAHRSWQWNLTYKGVTFNKRTGLRDPFPYSLYGRITGVVPEHCLPPIPPPCQFVGGFGDLVQRIDVGACHNNELSVAGGALQSAENGILFYSRDNLRLELFTWAHAWQALAAAPTVANQPSTVIARPAAAFAYYVECLFVGDFGYLVVNNPEVGLCLNNEQYVSGGAIQSTTNSILFYDRERLRLEFFNWQRVWQALAASQPSIPHIQAATAVPTAPQCQFVLDFAQWVQTNPGVGNCLNNELYVTGGSLQSIQNGVLFYDLDNHRLRFFHWAQVWQAVAPLPFAQPQLPPYTETQTATHCQFVLGFANWVQQHADAGACLNSEQFLASGSVQSTQNGILFYDSSSQRLGFFNWEQVWQGLATFDDNQ